MKYIGMLNEWKYWKQFDLFSFALGKNTKWVTIFNFTFIWSKI